MGLRRTAEVFLTALWLAGCGAPDELLCDVGFAPVGGVCVDVDECAGEGHDCDEHAACANTEGSFSCACNGGYAGDGRACLDVDECAGEGEGHDCDEHAACANTEGSFSCACDEGWQGDGRSCARVRDAGLVIQHATLIDGLGAPPEPDVAIAIVGDRIAELGPAATLFVYDDDVVIDATGLFAVPGVVDAHVHMAYGGSVLEAWARAGVTTVREVGAPLYPPSEWAPVVSWDDWAAAILGGAAFEDLVPPELVFRDEQAARPEAARLLLSGPCLTATGGYPGDLLSLHVNAETVTEDGVEITPEEDARRKTALLAEAGVDVIKLCLEDHWGAESWGLLTAAQIGAIVEAAHEAGLRVTAHVSADAQLATCLAATPPIDEAAHIVADAMSDGNIAAMVALGVELVPTLAVWEALDWVCGDYGMCEAGANLGRFVDAGGVVAFGDDYGNDGIELGMPMRDLELMQAAGMTPMEILVAATSASAAACGVGDRVGSIEPDMLADVVLVGADPLVDLAALAQVAYVIRSGVVIRTPE